MPLKLNPLAGGRYRLGWPGPPDANYIEHQPEILLKISSRQAVTLQPAGQPGAKESRRGGTHGSILVQTSI